MIDQQKNELRSYVKGLKKMHSLDEKKRLSIELFKKIESLPEFEAAKCIMMYWSMSDEVHTHEFVEKWHTTKKIILPVVQSDQLVLKEFQGTDKLIVGKSFGILEPDGEPYTKTDEIDLILVPGLAFDKNNNRLGRGKAYYDKLLSSTKAFKLGICFDFQLVNNVPVDKHDIRMDLVITN